MQVTLLHFTPLQVCSHAIRQCWDSHDRSDDGGAKDQALIERVGNKNKHASTIEHLVYSFDIEGISRACLQELARHRIASYSVKSTRYTLKELKNEEPFIEEVFEPDDSYGDHAIALHPDYDAVEKYCVLTGAHDIDFGIAQALEHLRDVLKHGVSNDKAKYCLPEAYKVNLSMTVNARSLQNFLALRSSPQALWEIQDLAKALFGALPDDHKYLFKEFIHENS